MSIGNETYELEDGIRKGEDFSEHGRKQIPSF